MYLLIKIYSSEALSVLLYRYIHISSNYDSLVAEHNFKALCVYLVWHFLFRFFIFIRNIERLLSFMVHNLVLLVF